MSEVINIDSIIIISILYNVQQFWLASLIIIFCVLTSLTIYNNFGWHPLQYARILVGILYNDFFCHNFGDKFYCKVIVITCMQYGWIHKDYELFDKNTQGPINCLTRCTMQTYFHDRHACKMQKNTQWLGNV